MHTIEAVYLAPLTLILSLYLLFAGIILYDRSAVEHALNAALIRGCESAELDNNELIVYVEDEFRKLLAGRLIMAGGELNVKVSYESISMEYTGSVNLPELPFFNSSSISRELHSSSKISRLRRSKICRAVSALRNSNQ